MQIAGRFSIGNFCAIDANSPANLISEIDRADLAYYMFCHNTAITNDRKIIFLHRNEKHVSHLTRSTMSLFVTIMSFSISFYQAASANSTVAFILTDQINYWCFVFLVNQSVVVR